MDSCRGVHDWFECVSCDLLCTSRCPIEGNDIDVMAELSARLNAAVEVNTRGVELSSALDIKQ
jgi:hypothetical protein